MNLAGCSVKQHPLGIYADKMPSFTKTILISFQYFVRQLQYVRGNQGDVLLGGPVWEHKDMRRPERCYRYHLTPGTTSGRRKYACRADGCLSTNQGRDPLALDYS